MKSTSLTSEKIVSSALELILVGLIQKFSQ